MLTSPSHSRPHVPGCRWFWAWAAVGCAIALATVSLGVLAFVPAVLLGGAMWRRPQARRSAFGLVSGAGVLLLVVAWIQRAGPPDHLDPLPWAIAGLVLFAAGVGGYDLSRRRARRRA
jgi:peptidoglycan/LPS O-acetylase OafA/YrhL